MKFNLYGLLIGLAILLSIEVAKKAKTRKITEEEIERTAWLVVAGGILGARIYHVLDHIDYYLQNPGLILAVWQGGLGIWGAIWGGLLTVWVLKKINKISNLVNTLDLAGLVLPLAQSIGRWGNYFNGELWGKNGEPIFLFESILSVLLFIVLWKWQDKFKPGQLFGAYLSGYGGIRLFLELWRAPVDQWWLDSTPVFLLFPIVSILIGQLITWRRRF